jgi:putative DNA primase/helicase
MTNIPEDDPFAAIANLIDSDDAASPFDADAPHPAAEGSPMGYGQDDDDATPADNQRPADADQLPSAVIEACAQEPQNDTGNGKRLLAWFADDLLHVRDVGWHAWAETRWLREGGNEIAVRHAQTTAARIVIEADFIAATPNEQRAIDAGEQAQRALADLDKITTPTADQTAQRKHLKSHIDAGNEARAALKARQIARRKYSVSSGNTGKVEGMLKQALPHRSVKVDDLDKDMLALNVENGTLRFLCREEPDPDASDHSPAMVKRWRVELQPHNRGDNITKVAPVSYDTSATCPAFIKAVERFQPIEPVREFLRRYHGYALTGQTGEQCLVFNYGTGSNWKSTFIEILSRIMGDYCATLAFESLAGDNQRSGSQASPDLARLPGARLVRASEPERGVQFKESLIKSLTGGEPMLVRQNFKEFFEFRPAFKLVLSGNHKPEIGGVDHGIWRRIKFVPWPVTIGEHEKRPMDDVIAELWAERSGILNWLIAGALDFLNGGLRTPQEVIDATAEYRSEMDPVGGFVGDCIESIPSLPDGKPASAVRARQMYDAFDAWCYANGVRAWKEKGFATAMSQKGFKKERGSEGQKYLHVRLKDVPKGRRPAGADRTPPHPADEDEVPL